MGIHYLLNRLASKSALRNVSKLLAAQYTCPVLSPTSQRDEIMKGFPWQLIRCLILLTVVQRSDSDIRRWVVAERQKERCFVKSTLDAEEGRQALLKDIGTQVGVTPVKTCL